MSKPPTLREYLTKLKTGWGSDVTGNFSTVFVVAYFLVTIIGLAVTSLQGNVPGIVITGTLFASAFIFQSYRLWRDERNISIDLENKLKPKLQLLFDPHERSYIQEYPLDGNPNSPNFTWARILVKCADTSIRVENCKGYLKAAYRMGDKSYEPLSFNDSYQLTWAPDDKFSPERITVEKPRYLNVFSIGTIPTTHISLCIYERGEMRITPLWMDDAFKNPGIYKFDFLVEGDDYASASLSLKVKLAKEHKDCDISLESN